MKEVLIIEDDKNIVDLLTIHLRDISCNVSMAHNGLEGLKMALAQPPDLIILDITMPKMDGIEVCQKIRAKQNTPIIMLTAKAEEIDKVIGLEVGADDYMTKPFSVRELLARVKALFRRSEMTEEKGLITESVMKFEGLLIDIERHRVDVDGSKVDLSPKEFEILILMASNPGRSYSRSDLLRLIWGYDFDGYEHTVNSHINRLRSKIEADMSNPKYVLTTWGVGYKFNEDLN